MKNKLTVVLASALLLTATAFAAESISLEGIKCVVAGGKDAKAANSAEYKGGQVFFCCGNCPKAFEANTAKYAARANAQLVATKQAKQGACPLSGGKLNPDTAIEVAGAKVCFCCNNCKGKVAGLQGDEQLNAVFSEAAWEKAKFKVAKSEK
ncbi:MAG: hypothetical protein KDA59_01890 [Planctomycetales bacterium]|nr:hypothetical protein [Planctomycetales bacterium]